MKPIRVGSVIRVEFWDHADGEEPAVIEAFGRVRKVDRKAIVLVGWQPVDSESFESEACWTILRSTLIGVTIFRA